MVNMSEVEYYCTTWRVDFDCLPFGRQISSIIEILFYYKISQFTLKDIKDFYYKLKISNPRSNGIRKPSSQQIVNALPKMSNIQFIGDETYLIIEADTSIYAMEIIQGYDETRIE